MIRQLATLAVDQILQKLPRRSKLLVSYYIRFRHWPNVRKPKSFNEKILWRKLYEHDLSFIKAVDKVAAREIVSGTIGAGFLVPMQGVFKSYEDIPFAHLSYPCVLKTSSGSGAVRILRVHDEDSIRECISYFRNLPSISYGEEFGEWAYDFVEPKIIVEDMLSPDGCSVPVDYKFYVYDGRVHFFHMDIDRFEDHHRVVFGRDLRPMEFRLNYPRPKVVPVLSNKIEEMIVVAEKLGSSWDFVRVDLYEVKGAIYFGEFTFYPGAGMERFLPSTWDFELGRPWPIREFS